MTFGNVRHVVTYLAALSLCERDNARFPVTKKCLISQLAYRLRQAFLTATRQAVEAPKTGHLPGKKPLEEPLELSKSGVVDLRFLGFLLRMNFDTMLARCNISKRLLPNRLKIISG
ncbi:hypothetical protein [Pseudomonas sp. NFACC37-1]|uniref:hypothetical protein n=1 Tax=Pseudomonas sp. NFACC37-1 TaxID=1566196 RepID=UPI00087F9AEE|nr:hypothetical protein [Pseudomonas sp. NFACC37-1]SCY23704.1 hypothetical protein SAMN03159391_01286 [Pseudomonas sp. NFACC37-1]